MKTKGTFLVLLLLSVGVSGCASRQENHSELDQPMDSTAFDLQSSQMKSCGAFVDDLLGAEIESLKQEKSAEGMRAVLQRDAVKKFSKFVLALQVSNYREGALNPTISSDRKLALQGMLREAEKLPGFKVSKCEAVFSEYLAEYFFKGIGGQKAKVIGQLTRAGVTDSHEQKWILLAALVVGKLPSGWDMQKTSRE
jgi:hypothetical protein